MEQYALMNVETDRMTNSLNTLSGEVLQWTAIRSDLCRSAVMLLRRNIAPADIEEIAAAFQALRDRRLTPLVPVVSLLGIWWNLGLVVQFALQMMDRQRLVLDVILYNQVVALPAQLAQPIVIVPTLSLISNTFMFLVLLRALSPLAELCRAYRHYR
jgi:hypothetical protein